MDARIIEPTATPEEDRSPEPDLRAVFEEHVDHVGNSLRRLGVRDADVPDLVQEVFLVLHNILPDYDRLRPMWPWIFGIVYRVAAAYRRKAFREVLDEDALSAERVDSTGSPDAALRDEENRRLVREALEDIPLPRRAVFVMVDLDEVSVPEAAEALGIELNTAYSRLRVAREEFRNAALRRERKGARR